MLKLGQKSRIPGNDDIDRFIPFRLDDLEDFFIHIGEAAFALFEFGRRGVAYFCQHCNGFEILRDNRIHVRGITLQRIFESGHLLGRGGHIAHHLLNLHALLSAANIFRTPCRYREQIRFHHARCFTQLGGDALNFFEYLGVKDVPFFRRDTDYADITRTKNLFHFERGRHEGMRARHDVVGINNDGQGLTTKMQENRRKQNKCKHSPAKTNNEPNITAHTLVS